MSLREEARDRPCMVRLPGICTQDPLTVVLAHYRLSGISGMSIKPPDLIGSWACAACHSHVDTHKDDATQLAFAHGVLRTQYALIKNGYEFRRGK